MMTAARIALAAVLLTAGAAACDDDDSGGSSRPEPGAGATTFAGTAEGGGTYVAIVVDAEGDALAYATDGDRSVDWLYGMVDNGTGSLDNDGGAVLEVTVDDHRASGTFTRPDSEPLRFSAGPASSPAGLYRAQDSFDDGDYIAGWIVLADGTQRGSVRRYETPLTPGSVDATAFSTGDDAFTVPGGELRVRRFGSNADV